MNPEHRIALFQKKEIRRTLHNNEWWFVITDVIVALTDSVDPQGYLKDMRRRDPELSKGGWQIATPLPIQTAGGLQKLNCANTEGLFRLIQSIPSPKAEPFKRWLARVGYERIQEIEDPELASKRTRAIYKAKGYSDDWIEKRMRAIAIRDELTDEWKKRGVKEQREYGIVTRDILTKLWTDWVDYWAVDFDYESRKEIILRPTTLGLDVAEGGLRPLEGISLDFEEYWTGSYIFENEWQSFRTRKDRSLELTTIAHTYDKPGRYTVPVKVIDIFGNDTMTLVPVHVG